MACALSWLDSYCFLGQDGRVCSVSCCTWTPFTCSPLGFRYSTSLLAIGANRLARRPMAKTTDERREAAPRCFVDEWVVLLSRLRYFPLTTSSNECLVATNLRKQMIPQIENFLRVLDREQIYNSRGTSLPILNSTFFCQIV